MPSNFTIITKAAALLVFVFLLAGSKGTYAQKVENKTCPVSYFRNNGNGQSVSVFAANILPNSVYLQNALTSGNQGNFTFKWESTIVNPPVINKTWVTSTSGVTSQNWIFGNNMAGSPFNPPGVPAGTDVMYTFYNSNLPTAGRITFEFIDPVTGAHVNTCSYPLSNGASSGGTLIDFAVTPASSFSYGNAKPAGNHGSAGKSVRPDINSGGGTVTFRLQNAPAGVSINSVTGEVSWEKTVAPGNYKIGIAASNGLLPEAAAEIALTIHSIPVVEEISGTTTVAPDASTRLYNATPDGVWSSGNSQVATITHDGTLRGVGVGSVQITYTVTNTYGSTSKSISVNVVTNGVGSGNNGGLESKSLGGALAERMFTKNVQNVPSVMNYRTSPRLENTGTRRMAGVQLKDFMPDQKSLGNEFSAYITSPTDITTFTNAADVVSVDYMAGGLNRAVAFCSKTYGGVYTHTKPVCDRLKGSELLSVDKISSGQYAFLQYHLKPESGLNEYAISFSVGYNKLDNRYTLQSEWMTDTYQAQDTMYNFQLWSSDISLLHSMLGSVLQKLNGSMPLQHAGLVKKPVTYITKAERDDRNQLQLKLTVNNQTEQTMATLVIAGKENEQSAAVITKSYPVTLKANAVSNITVPLQDMAEAEIRLVMAGATEDFVYNNDGIWNIYNTPSTRNTKFEISNDTIQPGTSEYRLFRNVNIRATTSDYVTVYRLVKGGGVAANLSQYNFLKFTASGNGKVRIRLIKKSITNYDEQVQYVLPLKVQGSDYSISLKEFKSANAAAKIKFDDVVIVSFTYEVDAAETQLVAELKNVRFAENAVEASLVKNSFVVYPNPANAQFNLAFESAANETMQFELIHASNGTMVEQKQVAVTKGFNNYTVRLHQSYPAGLYIIRLQSVNQTFVSKILLNK